MVGTLVNPRFATPAVTEQVVAFADLSGYHRVICSRLSPEETFAFLGEYYATVQRALEGSAGKIVKFIGDAALIVFPAADAKPAVAALHNLKAAVDAFLAQSGHDSRLRVKAHVGQVAAGPIGSGELERFDVCGLAVNQAALLADEEWNLSAELKAKIGT
ncbi:MAG TPA: adenylate/guanylate cyclase domain-containing protein [Lacunisphaera sp.]|nr:adenylate/guanylate cyclase domain-containing protein [Lacunisphaera sp.]